MDKGENKGKDSTGRKEIGVKEGEKNDSDGVRREKGTVMG